MLDFVVIKYKDKGIYLGADESRAIKEDKVYFKWFKDVDNAMWFDTYADAEKFAKEYFKNFADWELIWIDGYKYM